MGYASLFQVAGRLFVVNQVVDGGAQATDGARVAMLDRYRTELHGLGIEGEQSIGQQLTNARKVLQCFSSLYGAQHASDGSQDTCL